MQRFWLLNTSAFNLRFLQASIRFNYHRIRKGIVPWNRRSCSSDWGTDKSWRFLLTEATSQRNLLNSRCSCTPFFSLTTITNWIEQLFFLSLIKNTRTFETRQPILLRIEEITWYDKITTTMKNMQILWLTNVFRLV